MDHQYCLSGYNDIGLLCHKWWWAKYQDQAYVLCSLDSNFSSRVPYPSGIYKSGALCYRDCNKIGMLLVPVQETLHLFCTSTIISMGVSIIMGVIQAIGLIVSSAGLTSGYKALASGIKKIGKTTLKGMQRSVRKRWMKISNT